MKILEGMNKLVNQIRGQGRRKHFALLQQRIQRSTWSIFEDEIKSFLVVKITKQAENVLVAEMGFLVVKK
jgi:hypothetical protein